MAAILDFLKMSISQPFEEGLNLEIKLITPISITDNHFGNMAAILEQWRPSWILKMSISQLFEELQG